MRAVPRLCRFYSGICLITEEKARKNLSIYKRFPLDPNTSLFSHEHALTFIH